MLWDRQQTGINIDIIVITSTIAILVISSSQTYKIDEQGNH